MQYTRILHILIQRLSLWNGNTEMIEDQAAIAGNLVTKAFPHKPISRQRVQIWRRSASLALRGMRGPGFSSVLCEIAGEHACWIARYALLRRQSRVTADRRGGWRGWGNICTGGVRRLETSDRDYVYNCAKNIFYGLHDVNQSFSQIIQLVLYTDLINGQDIPSLLMTIN